MFRGTGTHFGSPLLGDERAGGGLYEEVPVDLQSRINRNAFFIDFHDGLDFSAGNTFLLTQLTAGGAVNPINPGANGQIRLTPAAVDAQGVGSFQYVTRSLMATTADSIDGMDNRIIACGARFLHSDFSIADWYFGLAESDTTLMGATGLLLTNGGDNCVGFHHIVDAVAQGGVTGPDGNNLRMVSAGTGVANYETTFLSAGNVAPVAVPTDAQIDGVFVSYGIKIIGTQNIEFYRNEKLVHRRRMSTALSTSVGLVPSFAIVSNGTDENFDIDYVWYSSSR